MFLVAQNCIKKDLELHFLFFTKESYRDFEVNSLVLRKYRAIFDIKSVYSNEVIDNLPQNYDNFLK